MRTFAIVMSPQLWMVAIRVVERKATLTQRRRGFRDGIKGYKGIHK